MARKARVHFPNALYHAIARGNQKQDIFLDERDYQTYLSYLSEYKVRFEFHLYAYALMRNHVHFLLEVEKVPLSRIMQVLQFRYTRYFNRRHGKVGHLFQGRYKAILRDKDPYLLELVRYIHLNPIRSRVVRNLEKYRWVGHLNYLGRRKDGLIDEEFVLSQFGKDKDSARNRYEGFILDGSDLGHQGKFYKVRDQRFLGEDDFIEEIEFKKAPDMPVLYDIPIEDAVMEVGRHLGINRDRIYSLTRDREGAHGRGVVAYLTRKLGGCLVKEIARHFRREPMTISEAIGKVENRIQKDEEFARRIDFIENSLTKRRKKKYLVTVA